MESLFLVDMTWIEVKEYLKRRKDIILPFGSVEEHGYHLPLSNPSIISEATFQKGGAKDVNHMVGEFGRRVSSTYNFAAQQQEIHRLDRTVTKNLLSLPAGEEKAELIIRFLEEIKEYFNDVDDSNGSLGSLTDECIETLAEDLDSLSEEKRADIVERLKKLEEDDEYGYFDYMTDVLEEVGR